MRSTAAVAGPMHPAIASVNLTSARTSTFPAGIGSCVGVMDRPPAVVVHRAGAFVEFGLKLFPKPPPPSDSVSPIVHKRIVTRVGSAPRERPLTGSDSCEWRLDVTGLPAGSTLEPGGGAGGRPVLQFTRCGVDERRTTGMGISRPLSRGILAGMVAGLVLSSPAAALEVGQKAPDFKLDASNGQAVQLVDLLGKGPVVIYTFIQAFGGV
jgi:hypothetical protein